VPLVVIVVAAYWATISLGMLSTETGGRVANEMMKEIHALPDLSNASSRGKYVAPAKVMSASETLVAGAGEPLALS